MALEILNFRSQYFLNFFQYFKKGLPTFSIIFVRSIFPSVNSFIHIILACAELHFGESMLKGGIGRKRDMGDIREFLNWAVLEKKYKV